MATIRFEIEGENMDDIMATIRSMVPEKDENEKLEDMSLQELLLYTSQRAEAEGYDMEVKRPLATARKEDARAKLRGDLEASVKAAEIAPYEDEEAEKPKPKKAKAKANGKESSADLKKRCIAALQKLYAEGHKAEVNKILADFGAGAKNFNTIPDEQFGPINEALEALTP